MMILDSSLTSTTTICLALAVILIQIAYSQAVSEEQMQDGEQQYNIIKRATKMPKYGACWRDALTKLESGCKELTDETQSKLAVYFTNCHHPGISRRHD